MGRGIAGRVFEGWVYQFEFFVEYVSVYGGDGDDFACSHGGGSQGRYVC
jgi:hypothetical protein